MHTKESPCGWILARVAYCAAGIGCSSTLTRCASPRPGTRNGKGDNFIDWRGIQLNGEHQIHPHIVGSISFANSSGPGWANPTGGTFQDDQRVLGRDGRRYGPLPRDWAKFRGLYHHGQQVILSYSVGSTDVLESPRVVIRDDAAKEPTFLRTFNLGPRERDLVLQVAEHPTPDSQALAVAGTNNSVTTFQPVPSDGSVVKDAAHAKVEFDGGTHLEVTDDSAFDLTEKDFSITLRLKTTVGGTIFALAQPGPKWSPNGQTFFVRGGRLGFDIGWVGVVTGKSKVDDGKWHHVAATWQKADRRVRLYVDGRLDGEGPLAAKADLPEGVVRIGFTAPNFPQPQSYFQGEMAEVRFYQRRLPDGWKNFDGPTRRRRRPDRPLEPCGSIRGTDRRCHWPWTRCRGATRRCDSATHRQSFDRRFFSRQHSCGLVGRRRPLALEDSRR